MTDQIYKSQDFDFRINGKIDFIPSRNILRDRNSQSGSRIEPLLTHLLKFLIEHRSRTITREELHEKFWNPDVFADEALTKAISKIRKLLGTNCIETVSKAGYRWVGNVEVIDLPRNTNGRPIAAVLSNKRVVWSLGLLLMILIVIKGIFFPHH